MGPTRYRDGGKKSPVGGWLVARLLAQLFFTRQRVVFEPFGTGPNNSYASKQHRSE